MMLSEAADPPWTEMEVTPEVIHHHHHPTNTGPAVTPGPTDKVAEATKKENSPGFLGLTWPHIIYGAATLKYYDYEKCSSEITFGVFFP